MSSKRERGSRGLYLSSPKKYDSLLVFESMKYWDMALRAPRTKDFYFRTMAAFLRWTSDPEISSPDDLLDFSDAEAVDLIRKFSHMYEQKGRKKMAQMVKTVMRSFFAANSRELKSPHLKVRKVSKTRRTYDRIVPTKEQVYSMADAATSLRDKAIVLTLWQSGLRNRTVRSLTIGHVKNGLLDNEVPIKIDVTPDIDKKTLREPYYTFIDHDSISAIRRYLRTRGAIPHLDEGEPLFLSNLKLGGAKRKMTGESIRRVIKNAARNAGMNPKSIWPHCLRSAFYNMLVGKVDDVQREFMFGHEMGVRSHYFAPQWVEKLKRAYLSVGWRRTAITLTKDDIRAEVIGALMGKISDAELAPVAQKLGISPHQIRALIRRVRGESELEERETDALLEREGKQKTATNGGYRNNHYKYKILTEKELVQHLDEGWDLLKELSNGKLVVRREND